MPAGFQKYKIEKIMQETADTRTFWLSPIGFPRPSFTPGQFVTVRLVDEKGMFKKDEAGKPLVRSYSISSSPFEEGHFSITVKLVGAFTKRLFEMKEWDALEAIGPLGNFCVQEDKMKEVVFLAGGSGVTPFVSMLSYYDKKPCATHFTLVYSCKREKDFILYKQLRTLSHPNIKAVFTLTRAEESPGWQGKQGRISATLIKDACEGRLEGKYFFICGPKEMIGAMQQQLRSLGIEEARIVVEKWG